MHVYVFTNGELILALSLTAMVAWVAARYWTMRRMGKLATVSGNGAADDLLEPVQQENRELRALVERLENRTRVLETIATDPAERTARAIEELR